MEYHDRHTRAAFPLPFCVGQAIAPTSGMSRRAPRNRGRSPRTFNSTAREVDKCHLDQTV
jgi:hypothetical protein